MTNPDSTQESGERWHWGFTRETKFAVDATLWRGDEIMLSDRIPLATRDYLNAQDALLRECREVLRDALAEHSHVHGDCSRCIRFRTLNERLGS